MTDDNVVPIRPAQPAAADPPAPPVGRIELVTVVGYGGLPLNRLITISDPSGQILFCSAGNHVDEASALAAFQQLCDVLGSTYDEANGTYFIARSRVDEHGRPVPGGKS